MTRRAWSLLWILAILVSAALAWSAAQLAADCNARGGVVVRSAVGWYECVRGVP